MREEMATTALLSAPVVRDRDHSEKLRVGYRPEVTEA